MASEQLEKAMKAHKEAIEKATDTHNEAVKKINELGKCLEAVAETQRGVVEAYNAE